MKISNSFIIGMATGMCLGYYLASENKEELIDRAKSAAGRIRDSAEEGLEKGKRFVKDMRRKGNEVAEEMEG